MNIIYQVFKSDSEGYDVRVGKIGTVCSHHNTKEEAEKEVFELTLKLFNLKEKFKEETAHENASITFY